MTQQHLFKEPLKPPEKGLVLRVVNWPEVFENARSMGDRRIPGKRGYVNMGWVANPCQINSTGYQTLLDSFDSLEALTIYGAWCVLTNKVASQAPLRGRLCGEKGEPYNTRRIARISGVGSPDGFELLIPWALEVGWLEWAFPFEPYPGFEHTYICPFHPKWNPLPDGQSTVGRPTVDEKKTPDQTRPDLTKPHPTKPVGGGDLLLGSWDEVQSRLEKLGVIANAKAVKAARAACWTLEHATAVIRHYESMPGAYGSAYTLRARFEEPAETDPQDGWPEPSAAWKTKQAIDKRREKDESENAARKEKLQRVRKERQQQGPVSFADHKLKLQDAVQAVKAGK